MVKQNPLINIGLKRSRYLCCQSLYHSLSLIIPLVIRCHSLPLIVISCHSLYHSLSLVVLLAVIRCHSLSFVCLFINRSLVVIYKSFIRPPIDYGDVIFDQAYNNSFHEKLENSQYSASLAITGAIRGT